MSARVCLVAGCLNAFLSVLLGAVGAHILKVRLSEYELSLFHTAAHYHGFHALGLILFGLYLTRAAEIKPAAKWVFWFFLGGIVLFSGSLYVISAFQFKVLARITPFGGLSLMLGWLLFAWVTLRQTEVEK